MFSLRLIRAQINTGFTSHGIPMEGSCQHSQCLLNQLCDLQSCLNQTYCLQTELAKQEIICSARDTKKERRRGHDRARRDQDFRWSAKGIQENKAGRRPPRTTCAFDRRRSAVFHGAALLVGADNPAFSLCRNRQMEEASCRNRSERTTTSNLRIERRRPHLRRYRRAAWH